MYIYSYIYDSRPRLNRTSHTYKYYVCVVRYVLYTTTTKRYKYSQVQGFAYAVYSLRRGST